MRKISDKYAEANNYLEIMQMAKQLKDDSESIKHFKKAFNLYLKENPADFEEIDNEEEIEFDEEGNIIEGEVITKDDVGSMDDIIKEVPKGTSSAVRAKCLAMFGIFIDKPIYDKEFLTFLDLQAGNDESKIAAIATLEGE